jgi:precorrin-2 dehydrogenase / sirohydrochlorin ferrochelatase
MATHPARPDPMNTTPDPQPDDRPVDYPVVLRVAGRQCLVVGGGPVAARRARSLVEAGARVTVVAPLVVDTIDRLSRPRPGIEWRTSDRPDPGAWLEIERRPYRAGEAAHYGLVVTATGRAEIDRLVVADAVAAGVLVNSADGHSPGSLQLPAVHRHGPITVAVSTGGASPALARWIRDRIVASIPPGVATMATLLDEARVAMRRAGRPTGSVDWDSVLDRQVAPLIAGGKVDEARAALFEACLLPGPEEPPAPE